MEDEIKHKKLTIVYCLHNLWTAGGVERVTVNKANYLVNQGYKVHIVTTDQKEIPVFFELSPLVELHDLGLNYQDDNSRGRIGRILALYKKRPLHKRKLQTLFQQIKPDVVVSTGFQESSILPSLRDGSKKIREYHVSKFVRVLMYPREKVFLRLFGKFKAYLDQRLTHSYDRFVCLTDEEFPIWGGGNNSRVVAIPNARSFSPRETISEGTEPISRKKKVIAVGRSSYQKNYSEMIHIWAQLNSKYDDWSLHIYTSPTQCLDELIKQYNLTDRVFIETPTPLIREKYEESSIYVLTSHFEGLPMVLLEAQACGLPIVSYACPSGPRDIITDGVDGFLIEPYNQKEFVSTLSKLMDDADLRTRMGEEALKSSERFALEPVMQRWMQLFDEVIQEP